WRLPCSCCSCGGQCRTTCRDNGARSRAWCSSGSSRPSSIRAGNMLQRKAKGEVDGRRARGEDNRRKIVNALLTLVERGVVSPGAEEVAAEAGVGLRTVFRHFVDMDSLYAEVSERMRAEIAPIIERPFQSAEWRGRLDELIDRRAQVFERVLPF